jgi:hypothetical protein
MPEKKTTAKNPDEKPKIKATERCNIMMSNSNQQQDKPPKPNPNPV